VFARYNHTIGKTLTIVILAFLTLLGVFFYLNQNNITFFSATTITGQDAYYSSNTFLDTTGINLGSTSNFVNLGGYYQSTATIATLTSTCITLPQSSGSTFDTWSYLEIDISNVSDIVSNELIIEDCSGNQLWSALTSIPTGITSVSIPTTITSPSIVLKYTATHNTDGSIPSRVNGWSVYGKSNNVTSLNIAPATTTVYSGQTITFNLEISSSGATTVSPVLEIDLTKLNGNGTIVGTSQDSTVCYDLDLDGVLNETEECAFYRPLTLVSVGNGPNGEVATHPGIGSTQDKVRWNLQNISDGTVISIPITFQVPLGYVNAKTIYLEASLRHGNLSNDSSHNNYMNIVTDSSGQLVTVSSVEGNYLAYSNYNNASATATGLQDYIYSSNGSIVNNSDFESVTVKIWNTGSCQTAFQNLLSPATAVAKHRIINTGTLTGKNFTEAEPLEFIIFRGVFNIPHAYWLNYNAGSTNPPPGVGCNDGQNINWAFEFEHTDKTYIRNTYHNILTETCRSGSSGFIHRIQSGLKVNTFYNTFPGYSEYYIQSTGSIKSGEYFSSWAFYGNEGTRTNTVTLQKSYYLVNISNTLSFHGFLDANGGGITNTNFKIYKDVDGTAPNPDHADFDIAFDPFDSDPTTPDTPHNKWYVVNATFPATGIPFSALPDANDPSAIVTGNNGERLLLVKFNEAPLTNFAPRLLWRVCDGSIEGGSCPAPSSSTIGVDSGRVFTQYQNNIRTCATFGNINLNFENTSRARIYNNSTQSSFMAGSNATFQITPHNDNLASEYPQSVWGINLFSVRDSIDFDNITSNISGIPANFPFPNQNIDLQSCDISQATFHVPDESICLASSDGGSSDCYAYWQVPAACQPPNGWGYRIVGNSSQDEYTPAYKLNFSIPIKRTVPAGTQLDFNAEVRTTDLTTLGSDNAVPVARWSASNYQNTSTITVLESPAIDGQQSAPVQWLQGSTMTILQSITNIGNAPNKGVYLVNMMPKNGVNGTTIPNPDYGRIYSTLGVSQASYLYSTDVNCYTDSLNPAITWTSLNAGTTMRSGYNSQSDVVPTNAICTKIHIESTSSFTLNPNDSINIGIDIHIPVSALDGQMIHNRAKVGGSTIYGSTSNVNPTEMILTNTQVGNDLILGLQKTYQVDPQRPGYVRWTLSYSNVSPTSTTNVNLVDNIPNELIFVEVDTTTLDSNEACGNITCTPTGTNSDGSGGNLSFVIDTLAQADGSSGGPDEGSISFWTRTNEPTALSSPITNCAVLSPTEAGIGSSACRTINITASNGVLDVEGDPDMGTTEVIIRKIGYGSGEYILTITNNQSTGAYFSIYDQLPAEITYTPGTLRINGSNASDSLITGGVLQINPNILINPGATLEIKFDFTVNASVPSGTIVANQMTITNCQNYNDYTNCSPAFLTNEVEFVVYNEPPNLVDDDIETDEDTQITFNVLTNDTDIDDSLNISTLNYTDNTTNGTLEYLGNGMFRYTPDDDYYGSDTFEYEICDSGSPVKCDTATVTITIISVNDAPVAVYDEIELDEDTSITFTVHDNDYDIDGTLDLSSISIVTLPLNGTLTYDATTNEFTYTPNANYYGNDQFEYEICDDEGACTVGIVMITINSINDEPVAIDDYYSITESRYLDILANDYDIDDGLDANSFRLVTNPTYGQVSSTSIITINSTAIGETFDVSRGEFMYTVPANATSYTDQFRYEICDYEGDCDEANVTVVYTAATPASTPVPSLTNTGSNILIVYVILASVVIGHWFVKRKLL
jgi:hypothetical protein